METRKRDGKKGQAYNPYLPLWEHVPDGEPHVFGDRVYIYGSHDRSHGTTFCMEDYVCWSAPVEDLSDWRREGMIFRKSDDPNNRGPVGCLYAPDVAQGPDGRYYLYYFYTGDETRAYKIGVAVCDTPAGQYQYYGTIEPDNGNSFLNFDPAVFVDDDGRVWLYYGSAFQMGGKVFTVLGGAVVELDRDMKTVLTKPKLTIPNILHQKGSSFSGHAFFEASSMRKVNGKYYLIYSSMLSHELCYGVAEQPDGPFTFGGTIISNGDVGLGGRGKKEAVAPTGNNHGSIVEIDGQWYVFYHRHTQGSSYARQGCAEPIAFDEKGRIAQAEITSCGLNGGPLRAQGTYPAAICCNLFETKNLKKSSASVCVDEEREDQESVSFISNMKNGSVAGYKYFAFEGNCRLTLRARVSLKDCSDFETLSPYKCKAEGKILVSTEADGKPVASMAFRSAAGDWEEYSCELNLSGRQALFFRYQGTGAVDIREIAFDR